VPLFLVPSELADGLALKEFALRVAIPPWTVIGPLVPPIRALSGFGMC
jgi:hypothetical protein